MADLAISGAAALTGAGLAAGDIFPVLDISAADGSKGSKITALELGNGLRRVGMAVGSGAILQVVVVSPKLDTASGSNVDPTWSVGYSGSITPIVSTSRIAVLCFPSIGVTAGYQAFARLEKSGTPLHQADAAGDRIRAHVGIRTENAPRNVLSCPLAGIDTPGSVSAQTYDLALAVETGGTWYVNRSSDDTDAAYVGRFVSTMFLIELA